MSDRRPIVILTKRENIRELAKWFHAHNIQIARKDLQKQSPRELQVARRAACFYGVMPRLGKRILDAKRAEASQKRVREKQARRSIAASAPLLYPDWPDWKMRAANDDTLD